MKTIIWAALAGLVILSNVCCTYNQLHTFACADYSQGKVFIVENNGRVVWEYPAPHSNDLWVLPNGNLLFTTGNGVLEMTRDKRIVFRYDSKSEVYACQRLENGNTFIGECNAGRLIEVSPAGEVIKELKLLPDGTNGGHAYMRNARKLSNGNYLVAHYGQQMVREYDPEGKTVWEVKAPGGPHTAIRLPNGNTLVSVADMTKDPRVYEFNREGAVVWDISNADLPDKPLKFLAGMQRLPNGNTVICNWLGHNQYGKAPHILEITRDKQVVWTYSNHKDMKTISTVVIMDQPANPLKGEVIH
ncbi:MAG: hypothetical protein MUP16_03780 [Sedimentisphaerales bacterium]|nr:hypothetical protein [Sedimentisphaerales bacterium]